MQYCIFSHCTKLININIPSGITAIGSHAFEYCVNLRNIIIPSTVKNIGEYAFNECTALSSITCNATTAPTIYNNTFYELKKCGTLYVPQGSGNSYNNVWMKGTSSYTCCYLINHNWVLVEQ
jgi:hypothetical protein